MLHNFLSTKESTGAETWDELPITDTSSNGRQRLCVDDECYDNADDFRETLEYSISDTKCDHSHFYIRKGVHNLLENLLTPVDDVEVIKEEHEEDTTPSPPIVEDLLSLYPDKLSEKFTHDNFENACDNGATSYPEIYSTTALPGSYHFAKNFCASMGLTLPTLQNTSEMEGLVPYGEKISAMWMDAFRSGDGGEDFRWYHNPTCQYDENEEFEESEDDDEVECIKTNDGQEINFVGGMPWYADDNGNPLAPFNNHSPDNIPFGVDFPVSKSMPEVNGRVGELKHAVPVLCQHSADILIPGFQWNEYCLYNLGTARKQTTADSALKLNVDRRNPTSSAAPRERDSGYIANDNNNVILFPAVCHATLADGSKVDYYGNVANHGEGTDGWKANLCYYITDEHYDQNTDQGMVYTTDSFDYINLDNSGRVWPVEPYQPIGADCLAWMGFDTGSWFDLHCYQGVNVICERRRMC
jgi:hypothetical protein